MQGVLSREKAEQEVGEWLDFKKMTPRRRLEREDAIKELTDGVEDGSFVIDPDTKKIKYKLLHPLKNETSIEELNFNTRANAGAIQGAMSDVKTDDVYGTINAYIAVLTDLHKAVVRKLDTEDYNMAKKIAIFFM